MEYGELSGYIEDKGYEACIDGCTKEVVTQLALLSSYFETQESKSKELAEIYLLIGEFG